MGQNRRYGTDVSDAAVNAFLTRPRPIGLTADELDGQDVTDLTVGESAAGESVRAWVRYPEQVVQVTGRVVAYTDRAVWVEYAHHDGSVHRVWVWAGAVTQ